MAIYTIGDLHLSFKNPKPMSIFGDNWNNHEEKIKKDWMSKVTENDLVILPGDFSWATYIQDTDKDFEYLNSLPGKKLLLKGNHDYWWTTLNKMREFVKNNNFHDIDFLYNNSYEYENCVFAGARGWNQSDDEEDKRLFKRDAMRLELSIQDGIKKYGTDKEMIVFTHYPPISKSNVTNNELNDVLKILKKYDIKTCYYAHLHGNSIKEAVEGEHFGINFKLVSADGVDFKLIKVK